jgi:hypothetical protein
VPQSGEALAKGVMVVNSKLERNLPLAGGVKGSIYAANLDNCLGLKYFELK